MGVLGPQQVNLQTQIATAKADMAAAQRAMTAAASAMLDAEPGGAAIELIQFARPALLEAQSVLLPSKPFRDQIAETAHGDEQKYQEGLLAAANSFLSAFVPAPDLTASAAFVLKLN